MNGISPYRPLMSQSGLEATHRIEALDEQGTPRAIDIAGERALTIYIDKVELLTLMTMGRRPEELVLGYLLNQGIIDRLEQVRAIQVAWDVEAAAVVTDGSIEGWQERLGRKTVTTGCGQGTVFASMMNRFDDIELARLRYTQSGIYELLDSLSRHNEIYRQAGAVHGCALCRGSEVVDFVEDVGRHNAVDTLAGRMLLDDLQGQELIFYTTGRLTSEMVIKVAQMGIPLLLSRSGLTQMGLEMAQRVGLTMIGRAKGKHFLVFNGQENIEFDQPPAPRPVRSATP
ncbi:formate dehydrogenase accessory sulfurtransferase FdhD [Aestuariirhabdus sp. Z084]|uniref:formate dehydrogenase accessory sulfurtransferase FdhD n=1 Tax=Aestuariirhabdus haliotis TaxID=2918751 RepID=UPI00201B3F12|nr:formate dehydrogenase accessory sulfurtransferase FdhD [Aestuariirhabdus haliotis]MCL6416259.1 formate dehydrogenase accessory sulfurtransferase FdhD [Aestuariirhabdus haliotis]MCL6420281.1 formate dehydrogenase accessory sulfurtransferase FdhD [Aestuariirhabdus haliotis]